MRDELTKKVNYSKEIEAAMSVEEIRLVNMLAEKEPSCYADIAAIIIEQTASQTTLIAEQAGEIERLKGVLNSVIDYYEKAPKYSSPLDMYKLAKNYDK